MAETTFARDGVSFRYPTTWSVDEESHDGGWTATLSGPGVAFLVVRLDEEVDDPVGLADAALGVMRETYPDLEAEDAVETVAGQPAVGHDATFITLDATTTCRLRGLSGPVGSVLVLAQWTDAAPDEGRVVCGAYQALEIDDAAF